MTHEEENLSQTTITTSAELVLLGHISNNISLLEQYNYSLHADDFHDDGGRISYSFLQDYYKTYSADLTPEKMALLHIKWIANNEVYRKLFKKPERIVEHFQVLQRLGDAHASADNIQYQAVKKAACIRRLKEAGIDTAFIEDAGNFPQMTSDDIMKLVSEKVDTISQNSVLHPTVDLVSSIKDTACRFMLEPDHGLQTPFPFINDYLHGLRKNDLTMIGANTNCGKSRMLVYILAYLVCVEKQPVLLLSNEMTQEQFEKILLCTIVNMPQLCALHGQTLHMTQSDITQPQFRTTDGQPIEKQLHETTEDYMKRLEAESSTFKAYLNILDWLQTNYRNMFHFKNISDDYSIERIRMEIRTAKKKGCRVVAYDTLKSCGSTEWGELQKTATELSELIKSDPDGITGLATFQLTDDTVYKKPEDLNSNNIANAKHIMHVTDNMLMFKMINPQEFCVKIQETSGDEKSISIPKDTNVAAFKIVKNRNGAGKDVLFGVQTNLDYNVWHPLGTLCRIYTR